MFDRNKFQIEVLKAMLSKQCYMRHISISDDEIGITDGHTITVFQKKTLMIRYEELPELKFDFSDAKKAHPQLFDSGVRKNSNIRLAKLWDKERKVFSIVNESFLSRFSGLNYFSEGGVAPVYVKDGLENLIGMILPVRSEGF